MSKSTIARLLGKVLYHFGRSKVDRKHRLKLSEEFTQSMTVMGRSELDKDELADAILNVSDETECSERGLAEATYYLAAAGYGNEIPTLLPDVAILADSGLCDLETAAEGLTTLMAQFNMGPDESRNIVAGLLHVIISTQLTISDAIRIFKTVGVQATILGKSFEEVIVDIETVCSQSENHYSPEVRKELRERYDQQLQELD